MNKPKYGVDCAPFSGYVALFPIFPVKVALLFSSFSWNRFVALLSSNFSPNADFSLQLIWRSHIQFPTLWHLEPTLHLNPYLHPIWTWLDLQIELQFLSPKVYWKLIDPPFDMLRIFDCTMEYSEMVGNQTAVIRTKNPIKYAFKNEFIPK